MKQIKAVKLEAVKHNISYEKMAYCLKIASQVCDYILLKDIKKSST